MKNEFKDGIISSIPIVLGYFFVSIGVGVYANNSSISALEAFVMSITNLTSAGEINAITIFGQNGTYFELFLSQILINSRYALMGISLSQKNFEKNFKTKSRLFLSFGITDEIFAVLINKKDNIGLKFSLPLVILPIIAWGTGTYIGAKLGSIIPNDISQCLNILIYAMLIAIIVPEGKKNKCILFTILCAVFFNVVFYYCFKRVSIGYSIIISSVISAVISAIIFPKSLEVKK